MNIQFEFPIEQLPWWAAGGALCLAAAAWLLWRLESRRAARVHAFVEAKLAPKLVLGNDRRLRRPLFWLALLGFAALLLTLAQPRWGQAWVRVEQPSRDILVLLDTSKSMLAEDIRPNRLKRAAMKIEAMTASLPGDRWGLIAFAGASALQVPLTHDHGYFLTVLHSVDTNTLSELGTDIAAALDEAADLFEEESAAAGGLRNSRAVLLVSDGEEVSGNAQRAANRLANHANIYTLGIGTPEGTLVHFPHWLRTGTRAPHLDRPHHSRLDEENLIAIANAGGGAYARMSADNSDIQHLMQHMSAMQAELRASDLRYQMVNRFQWPLAAAIAFLAAEGLWLALLPWLRQYRGRAVKDETGSLEHA